MFTLDILPALKREDSFVGRRNRTEFPEANFLPRWEYRVCALHVGPQMRRGMLEYPLVALVMSGRTVRPFEHGDSPPLSKDVTRAVPSTVLRHDRRGEVQPRTGHVLMCCRPLVCAVVADRLQ